MSNNIINFPRSANTVDYKPVAPKVPDQVPKTTNGLNNQSSHSETRGTSDGHRKKGSKSHSIEPNIKEIKGEVEGHAYRVQIRKSVGGQSFSFAKTFSKLSMARKWKKRKLAEIFRR